MAVSIGNKIELVRLEQVIRNDADKKVYMSKVFSFTPDYDHPIYAKEVERGGSGYAIKLVDGKIIEDKNNV